MLLNISVDKGKISFSFFLPYVGLGMIGAQSTLFLGFLSCMKNRFDGKTFSLYAADLLGLSYEKGANHP
ncbi:hypothetical protein H7F28_19910 [Brevibacterium sp. PAMC23299]|nr:hypothetical protein H7F28_19910 [Brevibacterium sp. PAMC23299]